MQGEEWIQWIERAGLGAVAVPFLEAVRALGFVGAQALLLGQPLLSGLVDEAALSRAACWLEDPGRVDELLELLQQGGKTP